MARTAEQYQKVFLDLLPKGFVWSKEPNSLLSQILLGLSDELVRVEERIENLYEEKDSQTTVELIEEHERDYGLPKPGEVISTITSERQETISSALLTVGQQFKEYFIEVAGALGYTITIDQYAPFLVGINGAGDPCGSLINLFYWKINVQTYIALSTYVEDVGFETFSDGTLTSPDDQYNTEAQFVFGGADVGGGFASATVELSNTSMTWTNGGDIVGTDAVYSGGFAASSEGGELYFKPDGLVATWDLFADSTYDGLKTFTFPKNANGDTDGGYFTYYFSSEAYVFALEGTTSKLILTQSGNVYKDSISDANLIVTIDGYIGVAGGGGYSIPSTENISSSKMNINNLKIKMELLKPGHTFLLFDFKGNGFSNGFTNGFDAIPYYDNSWSGLAFNPGFSSGFENNVDYNGIHMVGGFSQGFNVGFDRYNGGGFTDGFTQGFSRQN